MRKNRSTRWRSVGRKRSSGRRAKRSSGTRVGKSRNATAGEAAVGDRPDWTATFLDHILRPIDAEPAGLHFFPEQPLDHAPERIQVLFLAYRPRLDRRFL